MEKVYKNCKYTGPYCNSEGRLFINIDKFGKRTTLSYPKYIVEVAINRYLTEEETVHHIDGNPLNNNLENLAILARKEHSKLDSLKRKSIVTQCKWCNCNFLIEGSKLRYRERGKAGPFCSRSCSGKYGKSIQLGKPKKNTSNFLKVYVKERYTGNSINEELNIGEALTHNGDGNTEA